MVEGGGLENRWAFAGSVGSNPTSSVKRFLDVFIYRQSGYNSHFFYFHYF